MLELWLGGKKATLFFVDAALLLCVCTFPLYSLLICAHMIRNAGSHVPGVRRTLENFVGVSCRQFCWEFLNQFVFSDQLLHYVI